MKKVKVMLTAIILLGTVSGVLAIKARTTNDYCTAAPVGICSSRTCAGGARGSINATLGTTKCYRTTSDATKCDDDLPNCTVEGKILED